MLGSATKLQNSRKIKLTGAVNGEANFDGSKDTTISVTRNDRAIIKGEITVASSAAGEYQSASRQVNFPEGFNKDNCYISSIGIKAMQDERGYGYGNTAKYEVFDTLDNIVPCSVLLGDENNKIKITIENNYNAMTIKYKIVLEKE